MVCIIFIYSNGDTLKSNMYEFGEVNSWWPLKEKDLQLRAKQTSPLVNKHYQNKVTFREQSPS